MDESTKSCRVYTCVQMYVCTCNANTQFGNWSQQERGSTTDLERQPVLKLRCLSPPIQVVLLLLDDTYTHLEGSQEEILRSLPFANDLVGVASFLQQLWKQYFRILNSSHYILQCVCCAKQTQTLLTLTVMTANSSQPPIIRSIITGWERAVSLNLQHYHSLEVFPEQEMKGASWFSK